MADDEQDWCTNCDGRKCMACMACVFREVHDNCEDSCPMCCAKPSSGDGLITQYQRAHLNLLAGIEHQLTRIADSNAQPDVHLATEQVEQAWDAELRIYPDKAIPFLQRLGITVD